MSDANAYMNAYVDNAVGMIHEYVGGILQLKTQLKVCESIIETKNAELTDLKNQLIGDGNLGTENVELHQRCNNLQSDNNALAQKVSHMDNLLRQLSQMKQDIITRNNMIADLEQKLARQTETKLEVTTPVVINKNKKVIKPSTHKENDDF